MAIYTGGMRMKDEAKFASKRIAKQQAKAEKGEAKRKGRAGIFGKLAGMGIGHIAGMALAGVTGGIVNPMTLKLAQAAITGGSAWLGRAGAHQATTGKWDKVLPFGSLKTSGQVDKIEAGGKYGYGRGEAATLSEALAGERTSKEDWGTLAGGIAGSLATDIAGDLGEKYSKNLTDVLRGDKGKVLEKARGSVPIDVEEGFDMPWEAAEFSSDAPEEALKDLWSPKQIWDSPESLLTKADPTEEMSPMFSMQGLKTDVQDYFSPGRTYNANTGQYEYQQGGQVPQQQLMQLLALIQQQQETAYSGTPLEETKKPSSIADHFASQGKTLGGNNTQSLSQMLGR